ncbi:DEAD/DEAH box helicase, partial [Sphingorhabdus sp.]
MTVIPPIINNWFTQRGWSPRRHQLEMGDAAAEGRHALLVAATGAGKTLAGFLPTLLELIADSSVRAEPVEARIQPAQGSRPSTGSGRTENLGLHTLYISPLKALAVDVRRNLLVPVEEMGLLIRIETRTGDTPSERKARQRVKPP